MNKQEFEGYFQKEYVPIMRDESILLLSNICKETKPKTILEIGSYIGYSASVMLSVCNAEVITIEKDENNAKFARDNLSSYGFDGRFQVINDDAYNYLVNNKNQEQFDLIFLDGPKGQYIKYLPYLKKMLKVGGVIVADNVYFHGMVRIQGKIEHKHRTIVNNLRKFLNSICNDENLVTKIYDIEDGVSVSTKLK